MPEIPLGSLEQQQPLPSSTSKVLHDRRVKVGSLPKYILSDIPDAQAPAHLRKTRRNLPPGGICSWWPRDWRCPDDIAIWVSDGTSLASGDSLEGGRLSIKRWRSLFSRNAPVTIGMAAPAMRFRITAFPMHEYGDAAYWQTRGMAATINHGRML